MSPEALAVAPPPVADVPARPRRPRRREVEAVHHERWLVSYADFVTLLFAVFVTMYAMSRVNARKVDAVVDSMRLAFQPGHASSASSGTSGQGAGLAPGAGAGTGRAKLADLRGQLAEELKVQGAEKWVDLEMDERGLVISIREAGSFATGSADLCEEAQTLLRSLGAVLAHTDNQISVEGHTDDVPIHTARFTSNWQLSAARATTVVEYLIEEAGVRPEGVSAAGYADHRPRASNESEEGRAENRRVDLVVLNPPDGLQMAARR